MNGFFENKFVTRATVMFVVLLLAVQYSCVFVCQKVLKTNSNTVFSCKRHVLPYDTSIGICKTSKISKHKLCLQQATIRITVLLQSYAESSYFS